jgi:5-methylcytosine-specific restriction endonuclease McrA
VTLTTLKACRICGVSKALTDFHRDPTMRDGRKNRCRDCLNTRYHERYRGSPSYRVRLSPEQARLAQRAAEKRYKAKVSALRQELKTRGPLFVCGHCGMLRLLQGFPPCSSLCFTCIRQLSSEWYKQNRDRHRTRMAKWQRENRVIRNEIGKRWQKAHPDKIREKSARRRSLKRGSASERVDYERIRKRDRMICHLCDRRIAKSELHFDHVIPLSQGGTHSEDNVRVAHRTCNLKKGARYWQSAMSM